MTPLQIRHRRRPIIARAVKPPVSMITPETVTPTRQSNRSEVTPFASQIDPQYPVYGTPTTQSVRDNFQFAANEITDLQLVKVEDCPATPPGASWVRQLGNWENAIDGGVF